MEFKEMTRKILTLKKKKPRITWGGKVVIAKEWLKANVHKYPYTKDILKSAKKRLPDDVDYYALRYYLKHKTVSKKYLLAMSTSDFRYGFEELKVPSKDSVKQHAVNLLKHINKKA